ncbi:energy transducer TonB [Vitiosangium sp. GDMCC 1.1324]|uniref:energy transducer TonB n=1 Tax=Vitiosangium sp. (strain GDMCC 1.1324) TaxID=2138576 RepID=UPI000D376AFE|nr:energy transducer TonB [Vitiosangium sp. GDMCC 1.1324]PTL76261.1 hypothetical protein DAT35_50355 [Vitiosangium sp. GDMCC 1.1324]
MRQVSLMLLAGVLACPPLLACNAEEPLPPRETPPDTGAPPTEGTSASASVPASTGLYIIPEPDLANDMSESIGPCMVDSMTRPEMISGEPIRYTPEALRARVNGLVIAQCTITREGTVEDCRIIKGLPFMDEAVIETLQSRRYHPVLFQGKPISVKYTFSMRLKVP